MRSLTRTPSHRSPGHPPTRFRKISVRASETLLGAVLIGCAAPPVSPSARAATEGPYTAAAPEIRDGALVVAPGGTNASSGTATAPKRTIAAAISAARSGQTIVARGGSYHESLVVPDDKSLHLRAFPGERVTLEGSRAVAGFKPSGSAWMLYGWTTEFDSSPTHTRGAPDSGTPGWGFVDPAHPLAAHPDQVWVDGTAQRQVATRAGLRQATFDVDHGRHRLYLGSDPTGKNVRASDLVRALAVRAPDTSAENIDVRRFAPSVPDMGAVTVERRGVTLKNLTISNNATTGLHVGSPVAGIGAGAQWDVGRKHRLRRSPAHQQHDCAK